MGSAIITSNHNLLGKHVLFDFYKSLYDDTYKKKELLYQVSNSIIRYSVTTIGLLILTVRFFQPSTSALYWFFWLFSTLSLLCALVALICVFLSYCVASLEMVTKPNEWLEYQAIIQKKHSNPFIAKEKLEEAIIKRFSESATTNIESNTQRGQRLKIGNFAMHFAVISLVITFAIGNYNQIMSTKILSNNIDGKELTVNPELTADLVGLVTNGEKPTDPPPEPEPPGPGPDPSPGRPDPPRSAQIVNISHFLYFNKVRGNRPAPGIDQEQIRDGGAGSTKLRALASQTVGPGPLSPGAVRVLLVSVINYLV